jgi:hypothetical protein
MRLLLVGKSVGWRELVGWRRPRAARAAEGKAAITAAGTRPAAARAILGRPPAAGGVGCVGDRLQFAFFGRQLVLKLALYFYELPSRSES